MCYKNDLINSFLCNDIVRSFFYIYLLFNIKTFVFILIIKLRENSFKINSRKLTNSIKINLFAKNKITR